MKRFIILILMAFVAPVAIAHEVRPAYLELRQIDADTYDVLWKVPAREGERRLRVHVLAPDDAKRIPQGRGAFTGDAYLERWRIQRPGGLGGQTIEIEGLASTKIDVLARVVRLDGVTQTVVLSPSITSFTVDEIPDPSRIAVSYFRDGAIQIFSNAGHILFILALLLLARGSRMIISTLAAFILTTAVTIAAASLSGRTVPAPPLQACIALSVVIVAAEILRARQGRPGFISNAPAPAAAVFGIIHGLGLTADLTAIALPQTETLVTLLAFTLGAALTLTAAALLALIPITIARRAKPGSPPSPGRLVPYAIGGLAMAWTVQHIAGFVS